MAMKSNRLSLRADAGFHSGHRLVRFADSFETHLGQVTSKADVLHRNRNDMTGAVHIHVNVFGEFAGLGRRAKGNP